MLNILESDTKDFQKVVNNILIEVKPMRLRGKISDDFLGYVNKLRKQITDLEAKLAEKEKECAVWEKAYEYAIFECDFYKNHTQTTNEETMKRIEQLYEKILKRAKLLMGEK